MECHTDILGLLLFIVYINNIIKSCPEECNIKIFADDTLIYVMGESSARLERKMNIIINIREEWMNTNKDERRENNIYGR